MHLDIMYSLYFKMSVFNGGNFSPPSSVYCCPSPAPPVRFTYS